MDHHRRQQKAIVQPRPQGGVALSRPLADVRQERHRYVLQADDTRPCMVLHPTDIDNNHVHVRVRRNRRHIHRWCATGSVLPCRTRVLELLRRLPHQVLRHVQCQPADIRQGVFPPPRCAVLHRHIQHDQAWHTVPALRGGISLLCLHARRVQCQLDDLPFASACHYAGVHRTWIRSCHLLNDHQIPRSPFPRFLRCPTVDVCHSRHLSPVGDEEQLSRQDMADCSQSSDSHHRDIQVWIHRRRSVRVVVSSL